mgnify:CR=1 FL=1|tara:strand:- start:125580 stop:125738 length:159 start_codon:yes stop_codon:yes gene_type:complete
MARHPEVKEKDFINAALKLAEKVLAQAAQLMQLGKTRCLLTGQLVTLPDRQY